MTLSFSTQIKGKPTYFMEKISKSVKTVLFESNPPIHFDKKFVHPEINLGQLATAKNKIHTIRADKKDRWKAGNDIHFVIKNRTKNRFQFAPVIKVKSVQEIEVCWGLNIVEVKIEGIGQPLCALHDDGILSKILSPELEELAKNDGFDTVQDFFNYFNSDFIGKIIHWTSFSY